MKRLLLFVALVGLFVVPVQAQEVAGCDADSVATVIQSVVDATTTAQAEADPAAAIDLLAGVAGQVAALRAVCNGLFFTDTEPALIGPIDFPEGLYRAIATTENYLIAGLTVLEGECGQGSGRRLSEFLFSVSGGDAVEGAEVLFTSRGCTALIEISNTRGEWALQFEVIS
jgi:hypothetical protein